jgi:hypothetical protein
VVSISIAARADYRPEADVPDEQGYLDDFCARVPAISDSDRHQKRPILVYSSAVPTHPG